MARSLTRLGMEGVRRKKGNMEYRNEGMLEVKRERGKVERNVR